MPTLYTPKQMYLHFKAHNKKAHEYLDPFLDDTYTEAMSKGGEALKGYTDPQDIHNFLREWFLGIYGDQGEGFTHYNVLRDSAEKGDQDIADQIDQERQEVLDNLTEWLRHEIILSKDELLEELKALGQHPSGRKVRADKGKQHQRHQTLRQERADKGQTRGPRKRSQTIEELNRAHMRRVHSYCPEGTLPPMFPDHIFWLGQLKKRSSRNDRPNTTNHVDRPIRHLEETRFNLFQAEAQEPHIRNMPLVFGRPGVWPTTKDRFCSFYYIREEDIPWWTFSEWRVAYLYYIHYQNLCTHSNTTFKRCSCKINYNQFMQDTLDGKLDETKRRWPHV